MKKLFAALVTLALISPTFGMATVPEDYTQSPQLPSPIVIHHPHKVTSVAQDHPRPLRSHPRPMAPQAPPEAPQGPVCPELPLVPEVRHVYPASPPAADEHWEIQWLSLAADGIVGLAAIILIVFGIRKWRARKGTPAT